MKLFMFVAIAVLSVTMAGFAQELLPELALPAAKHKAAVEVLEKQRLEAVAQAARSYVSALDGVERTATAKGEVDLVAAVVKEREAAVEGTLEEEVPSMLPKVKLQGARKALLAKAGQVAADFTKRHKQLDAEYLKTLAALQAKAAPDSDLAKQVVAAKAALLNGGDNVDAGESGKKTSKPSHGKNVVVNLNFEQVAAGDWPLPICATVEKEGNNTFFRFDDKMIITKEGSVPFFCSRKEIEFPANVKTVNVSAKIRTTNCVSPKTEPKFPKAQVCFENQAGKTFFYVSAIWDKKNGPWKTIHAEETPIPNEAFKAFVILTNGRCAGQIDFDDVEVTFK